MPVGKIYVGQQEELSCCSDKCPGTCLFFFYHLQVHFILRLWFVAKFEHAHDYIYPISRFKIFICHIHDYIENI